MKISNIAKFAAAAAAALLFGCATPKGNCRPAAAPSAEKLCAEAESRRAANSNFKTAFDFIKSRDMAKLADGRYNIDADNVILIVSDSARRPRASALLEAHKKYIDLQYVIKGSDLIGVKNTADCKAVQTPYNPEKDIMFFSDAFDNFVLLNEGEFVVLAPENAHAPCIGEGTVRKAIFKIKVK